MNMRRWLWWSD